MKNTLKLLLLLLVLGSCSNENESIPKENVAVQNNLSLKEGLPPATAIPNVYSAFTIVQNSLGGSLPKRARLRINDNTITELSSINSGANTVAVSNIGDVYVGGYEEDLSNSYWPNYTKGKIWKNGLNYFTSSIGGEVRSVITQNNDVYFIFGNSVYKNNIVLYNLTCQPSNTCSYGNVKLYKIYVYNSDIYVVGGVSSNECGKYSVVVWKNGNQTNFFIPQTQIFPEYDAQVDAAIYVDNTGVYITGFFDGGAKLWKNGIQIVLPTTNLHGSFSKSITGDQSFIYIAASCDYTNDPNENNMAGRLWKMNKTTGIVTTEKLYVGLRSCVVSNNSSIYVGGWTGIWKNNSILYPDYGNFSNCIYVK